jgi:hypothetical protein
MEQTKPKLPGGVIVAVLVVLALVFVVFRGCNPGQQAAAPQATQPAGTLGRAFTASQVDQNGCPVQTTTQFNSSETIYAGFTQSEIPRGTAIFARLSYGSQPIEDTSEITADRDLTSCVWFEFQPTGSGFQPGDYTVELFINGNRADQARLNVSGGPLGSAGGSLGAAQLGRLRTSTSVTSEGCPVGSVVSFRPGDAVYVVMEQSYIPAGTEMYTRLLYDGQNVEDTEPIRAGQDMNTCVWFVFEGAGDGLQAGSYEAQVYVNGQLADAIRFDVR